VTDLIFFVTYETFVFSSSQLYEKNDVSFWLFHICWKTHSSLYLCNGKKIIKELGRLRCCYECLVYHKDIESGRMF
jgi:hypothetical protein